MTVQVVNFGCRLNAHEAEVMRAEATAAQLSDTIIVNTCAVTGEAVRQARQAIRRLRRERPHARIVVTGCAAQTDQQGFGAMPEIDCVLGNPDKLDPQAWRAAKALLSAAPGQGPGESKVVVNDVMAIKQGALHLLDGFEGRCRAFVQVQNGCDHRCTFCIIPFARGPSRSVPMGEVVTQVRRLAANGYREVVLTGLDLTSYGGTLPGTPSLGRLVKAILKHVPELARLRLSSLDSIEADPDLCAAIADDGRLMPHFHLSLQAGDDLILKRMKRRHLRADAIAFCDRIRRLRPDVAFGADLIAGFPTETESMFARSLDLVEECGLLHLHVFPFSPRPGTAAARMPQVARDIVKERARRLRQKGEEVLRRRLDREIGSVRTVLAEAADRGRTEHFIEARPGKQGRGHPLAPGTLVDVTITGHDGRRLLAVPASPQEAACWPASGAAAGHPQARSRA